MLFRRLKSEFGMLACTSRAVCELPELRPREITFPLEFMVHLREIKAMKLSDGRVVTANENSFSVLISRDYPFMKPRVRWMTEIFHPNISPPADGGVVCIRLLQEWKVDRTLLSLVEGVANLVENPNTAEPLSYDACLKASAFLSDEGWRS